MLRSLLMNKSNVMSYSRVLLPRVLIAIFLLLQPCLCGVGVRAFQSTSDDATLRALTERFFRYYATKDSESFIKLWSAKSTQIESRKKSMQDLYAKTGPVDLKSLTVADVAIDGENARVRINAEMAAVDAKTGKLADGFGKMNRSLHFVKELAEWKVSRETSSEEELAGALAAAKSDDERAKVLAADKNLVNIDLRKALVDMSIRQRQRGKFSESISIAELARRIADRIGDRLGVGIATRGIGIARAELGDYGLALESFQATLAISEELGSKIQIAANLGNIGIVYRRQGNYGMALQYCQRALALQEAIPDKLGIAGSLNNIGVIYQFQGNYALAMEYYQKSLVIEETLGHKDGVASSLSNIGNVYYEQGDYSRAIEYQQKARIHYEQSEDKLGVATTFNNQGAAYTMLEDYAAASETYQKSLELNEANGSKISIADSLANLGFISIKQGNYQKALQLSERAISIAREAGLREQLQSALTVAGNAHRGLNHPEQASAAFDVA